MSVEAVNSEPVEHQGYKEEVESGDLNGRDVEIQEHKEKAVEKVTEFVKDSLKAGAVAGGAIAGAAVGGAIIAPIMIYDSSKKLIEGCKEYEEAVTIENESKGLDKFGNPIESDSYTWDE